MKKTVIPSLFALVALWAGWTIAYFAVENEYIVPSFFATIKEFGRLFANGAFYASLGRTLLRLGIAFLISLLLGISLALLSYCVKGARAFLAPIVSVLRTVPTMAVILILLIWTTPAFAPVVVTVLVLFPALYSAALSALDGVGEYELLAKVYRVPLKKRIVKMYLPISAPALFGQVGAILSMGLKITVSAEVLCKTYHSLGGMMSEAQSFVEMPELMALTLASVLVGFLLEGACALVMKFCVRWRQ